jgi:hypothetical protein
MFVPSHFCLSSSAEAFHQAKGANLLEIKSQLRHLIQQNLPDSVEYRARLLLYEILDSEDLDSTQIEQKLRLERFNSKPQWQRDYDHLEMRAKEKRKTMRMI